MSHYTRSPPASPYSSQGLAKFLVSRQAATRPSTADEKEALLQRYLGSLAEKPVHLSLAAVTPQAKVRSTLTAGAASTGQAGTGTVY